MGATAQMFSQSFETDVTAASLRRSSPCLARTSGLRCLGSSSPSTCPAKYSIHTGFRFDGKTFLTRIVPTVSPVKGCKRGFLVSMNSLQTSAGELCIRPRPRSIWMWGIPHPLAENPLSCSGLMYWEMEREDADAALTMLRVLQAARSKPSFALVLLSRSATTGTFLILSWLVWRYPARAIWREHTAALFSCSFARSSSLLSPMLRANDSSGSHSMASSRTLTIFWATSSVVVVVARIKASVSSFSSFFCSCFAFFFKAFRIQFIRTGDARRRSSTVAVSNHFMRSSFSLCWLLISRAYARRSNPSPFPSSVMMVRINVCM
mmetsp:Transcript_10424/g.21946  ORF Transcript_10424/g.21946 Transcript_10424/m.21946 type:complete len:321 (-) Transcript_10424:110-1072(-)